MLFVTHSINLFTLFLFATILFLGAALIVPNASMKATLASHDRASATALMNASSLLITSFVVGVAGIFMVLSNLSLPLCLLLIGAASYGIVRGLEA